MKRVVLMVCCVVWLVVLGCGCGDGGEGSDVPAGGGNGDGAAGSGITIWWAQWAPSEGLQELGKEFEKETGIAVTVHQIPWPSYQDQVFMEFGNKKTAFDIVVGDSQWIGRGASEGLYVELTDWLPGAVDMSKVHERVVKYLCEYPAGSGKYFAAPCETDATGFAYRKDWFEDELEKEAFKKKYDRELTVPDTWKEFKQVAEFFERPKKNVHGCALLTGRGYDSLVMGFQQVMWEFGGSWGDPKSFQVKGYVDSDEAIEALTFFKSLLDYAPKGGSNFDYGKSLEAFNNGSVAMAMNYFAFYPTIAEKMGAKAGFFMMPAKGERRMVSLGGQGFSISAKVPVEQQEKAKKFIAWFLQTKVQEQWVQKPAGFTANNEILASETFRGATAYNKPFAESLDYLSDFWNQPVYNELLAVAQRYIGEAYDGVKTPEEAMKKVAVEHERIFRDAGLLK